MSLQYYYDVSICNCDAIFRNHVTVLVVDQGHDPLPTDTAMLYTTCLFSIILRFRPETVKTLIAILQARCYISRSARWSLKEYSYYFKIFKACILFQNANKTTEQLDYCSTVPRL
jgi:hypothetical protein